MARAKRFIWPPIPGKVGAPRGIARRAGQTGGAAGLLSDRSARELHLSVRNAEGAKSASTAENVTAVTLAPAAAVGPPGAALSHQPAVRGRQAASRLNKADERTAFSVLPLWAAAKPDSAANVAHW